MRKGKFTLKTLKQTNKMTLSWGVVTSQPGGGRERSLKILPVGACYSVYRAYERGGQLSFQSILKLLTIA